MASATSATSRGHASSPHRSEARRNALSDRWCAHETVVRHQEEKMLKPHTSLLAIFCSVALVVYAGRSSQADPQLVTESYMIRSRDPGIHLYVRNKRPEGMTHFSGETTLLYVHGTSQAASSTFDLPLDGVSW